MDVLTETSWLPTSVMCRASRDFLERNCFSKVKHFYPPPKMAISPAVFERQAHVSTSTPFMPSTENIWNCRQNFQESRDGDFLCFIFPSTFQQFFPCLCTTPFLTWEPGDLSPWPDHGPVWRLCVLRYCGPRSTFSTGSARHNTALSLVGAFCSGVEKSSSIFLFGYTVDIIPFSNPNLCENQTWPWCPSLLMLYQKLSYWWKLDTKALCLAD